MSLNKSSQVVLLVMAERVRQEGLRIDRKWAPLESESYHVLNTVTTEEVGEMAQAMLELGRAKNREEGRLRLESLRDEAIQVAAMGAMIAEKALEELEELERPTSGISQMSPTTPPSPSSPTPIPTGGREPHRSQGIATEIVFPGKIPGNNGAGGLLRMHWTKKRGLLAYYQLLANITRPRRRHEGPVRLELIRYSTGGQMDFDNLVSTGKLILDAIVKAGILPDDNPAIIAECSYAQERAASKEAQRTVIRITDL